MGLLAMSYCILRYGAAVYLLYNILVVFLSDLSLITDHVQCS